MALNNEQGGRREVGRPELRWVSWRRGSHSQHRRFGRPAKLQGPRSQRELDSAHSSPRSLHTPVFLCVHSPWTSSTGQGNAVRTVCALEAEPPENCSLCPMTKPLWNIISLTHRKLCVCHPTAAASTATGKAWPVFRNFRMYMSMRNLLVGLRTGVEWRFWWFTPKYRVLQIELYNFESLYKFIQRTCTVFWTVIMLQNTVTHWTITIPGKTRCALLHYDSSKHRAKSPE
jgi:hypothetical protein